MATFCLRFGFVYVDQHIIAVDAERQALMAVPEVS